MKASVKRARQAARMGSFVSSPASRGRAFAPRPLALAVAGALVAGALGTLPCAAWAAGGGGANPPGGNSGSTHGGDGNGGGGGGGGTGAPGAAASGGMGADGSAGTLGAAGGPGGAQGSGAASLTNPAGNTVSGATGTDGGTDGVAGAGGGGGGAGAISSVLSNSGTVAGGAGGAGGTGTSFGGGGGGGGAGVTPQIGGGSITNLSGGTIAGGNGGAGGDSAGTGGAGGGGGDAVLVQGSGATILNSGAITGGNGGAAGAGFNGSAGTAGAGIDVKAGGNATITNFSGGGITGGTASGGANGGAGIRLQAGGNTINNNAGANINGGLGSGSDAGGAGVQTFGSDTINNSGNITGGGAVFGGYGIDLIGTGNAVNNLSGGSISGWQAPGILVLQSGNIINNLAGAGIWGGSGGDGIKVVGGGATIVNGGSINNGSGGTAGINLLLGGGSTIINGVGGQINGPAGIITFGGDTITNRGAINGDAGGDAILFNGTGNSLLLSSTASFTGKLTLANNATASISIAAGSLNLANTIAMGSATTLTLNGGSGMLTLGPITGPGGNLTVSGGTVTLGGANTYLGMTTVNGTLLLTGSVVSSTVQVNSGGAFGGSGGTVNSTATISAGGALAPANAGGAALTINGQLTFASGSFYDVQAIPGAVARVDVNAPVVINGTSVRVLAGSGTYARDATYTILTSQGLTGTFTGVTSNLAFLTPTLIYQGNNVLLELVASQNTYSSVAASPNQAGVAGVLAGIQAAGGNALTNQIDNLSAGQAQTAFDSLSGVQHAAASHAGLAMSGAFADGINGHLGSLSNGGGNGGANGGNGGGFGGIGAIKGGAMAFSSMASPWGVGGDTPYQLAGMTSAGGMASSAFNPTAYNSAVYNGGGYNDSYGSSYGNGHAYTGETGRAASGGGATFGPGLWAPNPAGETGLWSQALGTWGRTQSDGNGAGSRYNGGGFLAGADHALNPHWLVGAAAGYSRARWNASLNGSSPASGTVETPQGALYARYTQGPWLVSLSGGYADHKFDTTRSVVIGTSTNNAMSSHHGGEWSTDAQVEYTLASGLWQLRPLMGVRYSHLREDSFTESGAGSADLSMDARTTDSTTVSAGARVLRPFSQGSNGGYEFKAVYSHLFGDNDSPVSARLAGQSAVFTTSGTPLKRDAVTLSAGIGAALARNVSGFVEVQAEERGSGQEAYSIGGGLRLVW